MRRVMIVFASCISLGIAQTAVADIFRCKQPDGKTAYQHIPCADGEQKAIDERQTRKLREEQERKRKEVAPTASTPRV